MRLSDINPQSSRGGAHKLYLQVLLAIVAGLFIGHFWPNAGVALQPLGNAFIALIKMVIAPLIFLTVTTGIAGMDNAAEAGRVAGRAMVYFLFFSTLALIIGLITANVIKPGASLHIDPASLDSRAVGAFTEKAAHGHGLIDFFMSIIPNSVVSAFTSGNILQVLLIAILFGSSLSYMGTRGTEIVSFLKRLSEMVFGVVRIIMRLAPFGAFGAIAFTVGKYGLGAVENLALLVATFYLTAALFVVIILGTVARICGFSIFKLLGYLREELLIVLGTSSSEAALPSLIAKLENAGCSPSVVGLVVPMGYSFNLDGTNIYMTLASLFIAQATGVHLSLGEQVTLLLVAMVSSKGAAGVSGAGFVTLAATLAVVPSVPIGGMALILGIDRFMSECRSLTNIIGNAVAALVVAKWEKSLDMAQLEIALAGKLDGEKTPNQD